MPGHIIERIAHKKEKKPFVRRPKGLFMACNANFENEQYFKMFAAFQ